MSRDDMQSQTNGTDTMSNDVHNILDAISEAKAALDAKPTLERRIRELEAELAESQRHAQGLEENIIGYKADISTAKTETERLGNELLETQLRNLELEDRIHSVSRFLSTMQSEAVALDKSLNPQPQPTPEPIVEQPVELPLTGQSEANPTATTMDSVSDPVNQAVLNTSISTPVPSLGYNSGYNPGTSVVTEVEIKPQPYANRLYYYCRDYMPISQWVRDGGTEYSYYWRPVAGGEDDHVPTGYSTERFSA